MSQSDKRDLPDLGTIIAALIMAIQRQRPGAGLIHSDRGSQYAAGEYRDILQAAPSPNR